MMGNDKNDVKLYPIPATKTFVLDANDDGEGICVFRKGIALVFTRKDVIEMYDLVQKQKNEIIDLKDRLRKIPKLNV